jgi:hypothetical protein
MIMNIKSILFSSVILLLLLNSCEKKDYENTALTASKLVGQWRCEEHSSIYKSTMDFYTVNITVNESDSSKVLIENFYQLGGFYQVEAHIASMSLNISSQIVDNMKIQGNGTIKSGFDEINWTYTVDDGSGLIDQVTATFTKI